VNTLFSGVAPPRGAGTGFLQVIGSLLVGLFCFSFGVVRSKRRNGLAKTHGATACYLCLESIETARNCGARAEFR